MLISRATFSLFLVTSVFLPFHGNAQEVLFDWDFRDKTQAALGVHGCELTVEDGRLIGIVGENVPGAYFHLPEISVQSPVKLTMRVKTDAKMADRGEIYWRCKGSPGMDMAQMVRFEVAHDDVWHDYSIPLPTQCEIDLIRLQLGNGGERFEIEWLRLEQVPYPAEILQQRETIPKQVQLENDCLKVVFDSTQHLYEITDKRTGNRWASDGSESKALLYDVNVRSTTQMILGFYDQHTQAKYSVDVSLSETGQVGFEIRSDDYALPFYALNNYPPPLRKEKVSQGKLLFSNRSAGTYIDLDDPHFGNRYITVYGNTDCTDLPWMGMVDEADGDGCITLVETPTDALFHFRPYADGSHWPQIYWMESLDSVRYSRKLSYCLIPEGGYVGLSKHYRKIAQAKGLWIPFREKRLRKPLVDRMPGAPIIWGGLDAWIFAQESRTLGMRRAIINNTHHSLFDETKIRQLNQMGYLTGPYDSFGDAVEGPTGFNKDNMAETALHTRPGQGPTSGWVDELLNQTYFVRSSAYGLRALKSYLPLDQAEFGFNSRFIDVSMAMYLMEDWHPEHTFDRRQDLANRLEVFEWLDDMGLVLGTEHGNDWGFHAIEYSEGAVGGCDWWNARNPDGWSIPTLHRAESKDDYFPAYLKYGNGFDTRVPALQLVYHDAIVSTWYWADCPGFHYHADPSISDRKDLFTLLYGSVPLMWRGKRGYDWDLNRERFMRSYYDTCLFNEAVAFEEMLDHQFLSDDRSLQKTTFSGGYSAVVNFSDQPVTYQPNESDQVILAPLGYYVTGPEFHQSLLINNDKAVQTIRKPGYHIYRTADEHSFGQQTVQGFVAAFELEEGNWQLAMEPETTCRLAVDALTGWSANTPVALVLLDERGNARQVVQTTTAGTPLELQADPNQRFYALWPNPTAADMVIYPADDWVLAGDPILVSCPMQPETQIRCTLDGQPPTAASPIYGEALELSEGAWLRVQAYRGQEAVSPVISKLWQVRGNLYQSGLMKGGDPAQHVDVDLEGYTQLRLVVEDGRDCIWSDWANYGEAGFVMPDGSKQYLSDLTPVWHKQGDVTLGLDKVNKDDAPLTIAGQVYEKGLSTFSRSELVYDIPSGADRFETWVGLDDRADPGEKFLLGLTGTVEFLVYGIRPDSPANQNLKPVSIQLTQQHSPSVVEIKLPGDEGTLSLTLPVLMQIDNTELPIAPADIVSDWIETSEQGAILYAALLNNQMEYGWSLKPNVSAVEMEVWVTNRQAEPIAELRFGLSLENNQTPFNLVELSTTKPYGWEQASGQSDSALVLIQHPNTNQTGSMLMAKDIKSGITTTWRGVIEIVKDQP